MAKKTFEEVTEKIRDSFLDEFDNIEVLKKKGDLTENDLDYFLARDRKAAIILKTLQMDLQYETLKLKHGELKKLKWKQNYQNY